MAAQKYGRGTSRPADPGRAAAAAASGTGVPRRSATRSDSPAANPPASIQPMLATTGRPNPAKASRGAPGPARRRPRTSQVAPSSTSTQTTWTRNRALMAGSKPGRAPSASQAPGQRQPAYSMAAGTRARASTWLAASTRSSSRSRYPRGSGTGRGRLAVRASSTVATATRRTAPAPVSSSQPSSGPGSDQARPAARCRRAGTATRAATTARAAATWTLRRRRTGSPPFHSSRRCSGRGAARIVPWGRVTCSLPAQVRVPKYQRRPTRAVGTRAARATRRPGWCQNPSPRNRRKTWRSEQADLAAGHCQAARSIATPATLRTRVRVRLRASRRRTASSRRRRRSPAGSSRGCMKWLTLTRVKGRSSSHSTRSGEPEVSPPQE
jgi:hypothetical protein